MKKTKMRIGKTEKVRKAKTARCIASLNSYVNSEPVQLQCVLDMEHLGPHAWEDGSTSVSKDSYANAELHRRLDAIERVIHENLEYTKSVQRLLLDKADSTEDTQLRVIAAQLAVKVLSPEDTVESSTQKMDAFYRFLSDPSDAASLPLSATTYEDAYALFRNEQLDAAPHMSDCSLHNEPAYPSLPCDCGAVKVSATHAKEG